MINAPGLPVPATVTRPCTLSPSLGVVIVTPVAAIACPVAAAPIASVSCPLSEAAKYPPPPICAVCCR